MSIDIAAKFIGSKENLREKLKSYIYSEDEKYDEVTLSFLNKWIWIYFYDEDKTLFLDINFSKDFIKEERIMFIDILKDFDFQIDEVTNL